MKFTSGRDFEANISVPAFALLVLPGCQKRDFQVLKTVALYDFAGDLSAEERGLNDQFNQTKRLI